MNLTNIGTVKDNKVVICVEIVSDNDVIAVIAEEIGLDNGVFASESHKAVKYPLALLEVVAFNGIVLGAELLSLYPLVEELPVVGIVKLACLLFFFFGHFKPSIHQFIIRN